MSFSGGDSVALPRSYAFCGKRKKDERFLSGGKISRRPHADGTDRGNPRDAGEGRARRGIFLSISNKKRIAFRRLPKCNPFYVALFALTSS